MNLLFVGKRQSNKINLSESNSSTIKQAHFKKKKKKNQTMHCACHNPKHFGLTEEMA